jgi:hypothetical protein
MNVIYDEIVYDASNNLIQYTYTVSGSVKILTGMSFNYVEGGNTVATLPNEVTEIAENFADGDLIPSLKNITELIIGQNVNHYRKSIFNNLTSLTHLRLNQIIAPTVDHITYYYNSFYPAVIDSLSFKNSSLNTVTAYNVEEIKFILQYLLGPICYNIVTLNIIDVISISGGGFSILLFSNASGNSKPYDLVAVKNINTLTTANILSESFARFSNLTNISMPSVTSIGSNAFANCSELTRVSMPSVTSIGYDAFFLCPINIQSLQQLYYQGLLQVKTNTIYGFDPVTQSQIQSYDITGSTIIRIPTPALDAYYITIPNTITAIESNAALNATFITALTIPPSVTIIGDSAFSGCSNLTSLWLPSSPLVKLEQNSFFMTNVSQSSLQTMINQGYTTKNLIAAGFTDVPVTHVPCFNENSKILCLIDGEEKEVLIQNLRSGVLVKTFYSGYKPVCMIGTSVLYNPATDERFNDRLFICKKEKYPELNEDLIITGCHSILVDEITPVQRALIIKQMGAIYETENNYRLNAILDERAEPYNCAGKFNIYHIALEHNNYIANYGVYANGLLVESCSKRYLKEKSNMTLL